MTFRLLVILSMTSAFQSARASNFGVDYNLQRRCIQSSNILLPNYFQDLLDCQDVSKKHWTLAIETESRGRHCGPKDQTFQINSVGSPIHLDWKKITDQEHAYDVELKTDFSNVANPCEAPSFSWYAFMDHAFQGGGPLAPASDSWTSVQLSFDDFKPTRRGATRVMIGWQGQWIYLTGHQNENGSAEQKKGSFLIEMNVYLDPNWGKMPGTDPDIVTYNPATKYPFFYTAIDGSKYPTKYVLGKKSDSKITIHWTEIIQNMIARKLFPAPIHGLEAITPEAVYVATEVRNDENGPGGPIATLHFREFRESGSSK
jgi:hypothetical protein